MKLMYPVLLASVLWETRSQDQLLMLDPAITQHLLSSIPKISRVIGDKIVGKPDIIRDMISSVFGNGLLSQLVDPSQMANQLALNLNNSLVKPNPGSSNASESNGTKKKPRSKMSQLFLGVSNDPNELKEQLFVDGRPVKDEKKIFKIYDINKDPNQPERIGFEEAVANKPNSGGSYALKYTNEQRSRTATPAVTRKPYVTSTVKEPQRTTSNILMDADTILKTLNQFFEDDVSATTIQTSSAATAKSYRPVTQMQNDLPLISVGGNNGNYTLKNSDAFIDEILNSLKTRESKTLLPEEVKTLQQYLVLHEQNQQTLELLNKRQRLRQIQAQLNEYQMKIEEQRFREKQLRMQEAQLREEKLNVENQLQQQYNVWHHSFDVQPSLSLSPAHNAISSIKRLPQIESNLYDHDSKYISGNYYLGNPRLYHDYGSDLVVPHFGILPFMDYDEHHLVTNDDPLKEKDSRMMISGETWHGSETDVAENPVYEYMEPSALTLTPRLERPSAVRYLPNKFSSYEPHKCDCIEMDLSKLKGYWALPLSSISLQQTFKHGVAELFDDNTNSVQIDCANFEFLSVEQANQIQQVDFFWTFKTFHSEQYYKLNGRIEVEDGRIAHVFINDFIGRTYQIPLCLLKAGEQESNVYEYMVIVNADDTPCRSAAVLVRNPGTFFEEPSRELIYFLRHRIGTDQMDPMDVHMKPCPA